MHAAALGVLLYARQQQQLKINCSKGACRRRRGTPPVFLFDAVFRCSGARKCLCRVQVTAKFAGEFATKSDPVTSAS
jgi:hypothetical protein